MFELKNKEIVNIGINVVIHRWPEFGSEGEQLYNLSVFSEEKGIGRKYSGILERVVCPVHLRRIETIRGEHEKQKEIDLQRIKKAKKGKERDEANVISRQNVEALNKKLANPLHGIPESEFEVIWTEIQGGFRKDGLEVNEAVCVDQFNLEMGMTYYNYV